MTKRDDLLQDIFTTMDTQQRVMHGVFHSHFAKYGFSPAQLKLLFTLAYSDKCSLGPLAEKLYMTPGALSQLVEPLEKSGIVIRKHDNKDRRIIYLSLTKLGNKKLGEIKKSRNLFFKQALKELDEDELETFSGVQKKMFNYFSNHEFNKKADK